MLRGEACAGVRRLRALSGHLRSAATAAGKYKNNKLYKPRVLQSPCHTYSKCPAGQHAGVNSGHLINNL